MTRTTLTDTTKLINLQHEPPKLKDKNIPVHRLDLDGVLRQQIQIKCWRILRLAWSIIISGWER